MDHLVRIGMYVIVGVILLTLNFVYFRRVYYEFHRVEPSPVIAPFRVVGVKDEPEKGKALAQMLIARVNRLNDEIGDAIDVLNKSSTPEKGEDAEAAAVGEPAPDDIRFAAGSRDNLNFGQFDPVDVNLSFGGVEVGGLVSWGQRLLMSDRVVSISVQYDAQKTTLSMTPNRTAGESIWLEVDKVDDRELVTKLAYAFVKRGWESRDENEDIRKLTLDEFIVLMDLVRGAAAVKLAHGRTTPDDYKPLDEAIGTLLTPYSRAWESQRILKLCAVVADKADNDARAMDLYTRLTPEDEKEKEFVKRATLRLAALLADPGTTQILVASAPQPMPVPVAAAPPPARSLPTAARTAEPEPTVPAVTTTTTPVPAPPEPVQPAPAPPVAPVTAFVRGSDSLLAQIHVPDAPMEGAPLVAIIGASPDPRVQPFTALLPETGRTPSYLTEYSTHLAEFVRLVAPKARLGFLHVDPSRSGDLRNALIASMQHKPDIVLLTYGPLSPDLEKLVETIAASGTLVVTSAGNEGRGVPPNMNNAADRVLVVAAADAAGQPAPFTQSSEQSVWAPGTGFMIASLRGEVTRRSGTSYAAAIAAGVAARVLAAKKMEPKDAVKLLRTTSKPVVTGGPPLLNVEEALKAARRIG